MIQGDCEELAVALYPCGGFFSETFIFEAAEQINNRDDDRPVTIFYIGDYDPAGVWIDRDLESKLRRHLSDDVYMDFVRLAITPEQIDQYRFADKAPKGNRSAGAACNADSRSGSHAGAHHARPAAREYRGAASSRCSPHRESCRGMDRLTSENLPAMLIIGGRWYHRLRHALRKTRARLSNRRNSEIIDTTFRGKSYAVTFARFPDGLIGKVFIDPARVARDVAEDSRDTGIILSIALQHGVPLACMRAAVSRVEQDKPLSLASHVPDLVAAEGLIEALAALVRERVYKGQRYRCVGL